MCCSTWSLRTPCCHHLLKCGPFRSGLWVVPEEQTEVFPNVCSSWYWSSLSRHQLARPQDLNTSGLILSTPIPAFEPKVPPLDRSWTLGRWGVLAQLCRLGAVSSLIHQGDGSCLPYISDADVPWQPPGMVPPFPFVVFHYWLRSMRVRNVPVLPCMYLMMSPVTLLLLISVSPLQVEGMYFHFGKTGFHQSASSMGMIEALLGSCLILGNSMDLFSCEDFNQLYFFHKKTLREHLCKWLCTLR